MYKILGVIIVLLSIIFSIGVYKKIDTLNNGEKITVYVIDIPRPCENAYRKLKPYFSFSYYDRVFTKNIKGDYCITLAKGDVLTLITNNDNSYFIYPDENFKSDIIVIILFYAFGLFLFFKKQKNENNHINNRNFYKS
jgi:hypothetical protein